MKSLHKHEIDRENVSSKTQYRIILWNRLCFSASEYVHSKVTPAAPLKCYVHRVFAARIILHHSQPNWLHQTWYHFACLTELFKTICCLCSPAVTLNSVIVQIHTNWFFFKLLENLHGWSLIQSMDVICTRQGHFYRLSWLDYWK